MKDYAAIQRRVTYHKRALTIAKKKGPAEVIDAVNAFYEEFYDNGWPYPDSHHDWQRARLDASFELQRGL